MGTCQLVPSFNRQQHLGMSDSSAVPWLPKTCTIFTVHLDACHSLGHSILSWVLLTLKTTLWDRETKTQKSLIIFPKSHTTTGERIKRNPNSTVLLYHTKNRGKLFPIFLFTFGALVAPRTGGRQIPAKPIWYLHWYFFLIESYAWVIALVQQHL